MKTKNITLNTKPSKILSIFNDCKDTESVNLKTDFGFITLCGGILSKTVGHEMYLAINGNWVLQ